MPTRTFQPYTPRRLAFAGIQTVEGYRLKIYSIVHEDQTPDVGRFEAIFGEVTKTLPQPATSEARPGAGFTIFHQGRTADYLVVCWWDQENELPIRVYVSKEDVWKPASGGESVCVWDLRVIWWEREAYVNTVLANRPDGVDAYLAMTLNGFA